MKGKKLITIEIRIDQTFSNVGCRLDKKRGARVQSVSFHHLSLTDFDHDGLKTFESVVRVGPAIIDRRGGGEEEEEREVATMEATSSRKLYSYRGLHHHRRHGRPVRVHRLVLMTISLAIAVLFVVAIHGLWHLHARVAVSDSPSSSRDLRDRERRVVDDGIGLLAGPLLPRSENSTSAKSNGSAGAPGGVAPEVTARAIIITPTSAIGPSLTVVEEEEAAQAPRPSVPSDVTLSSHDTSYLPDIPLLQDDLRLPPLESILNVVTDEIVGDPQVLLQFAIVGFGKCGTTTLLRWLSSHPQLQMLSSEVWALVSREPHALIRRLHRSLSHPHKRRGYKCPGDVLSPISMAQYYREYWPSAKLIIAIRHPVLWFRSLYNFRVQNYLEFERMLHPNDLIGPCTHGSMKTCTRRGFFAYV